MKYSKILEVKEDDERVYFSFFTDNKTQNIIGIPKADSKNQEIYAGTNYHTLLKVEKEKAKFVLTEMMKRVLVVHPAIQLCNKETLKLIG
jgi:hypothetical protein